MHAGSGRAGIVGAVAALLLALPASASPDNTVLTALTGPGDAITLAGPDGRPVTQLAPGTYTIQVRDTSDRRDFTLRGPGVSEHTGFEPVVERTWTVTLGEGMYSFFSERHVKLHGSFTAGAPTRSNARLLHAVVGPDFSIALVDANWQPLTKLIPFGRWTISVEDRTTDHNFWLFGPRVNRQTALEFVGTATWQVTLRGGLYLFRRGPHDIMIGDFRVKRPPVKAKPPGKEKKT